MDIVKEIGLPAMLEQTAEECVELAHACLKIARYMRGDNPTNAMHDEMVNNLVEELSDVLLCAEYILEGFDIEDRVIADTQYFKLERWKARINRMKEIKNEQSGEKKESEE